MKLTPKEKKTIKLWLNWEPFRPSPPDWNIVALVLLKLLESQKESCSDFEQDQTP